MLFTFDKRTLRYFDWINFLLILILSTVSIFSVYSATYQPGKPVLIFFYKQIFGIITGIIIFFLASYTDYRQLQRWGYFLYIITIIMLLFALVKGSIGLGAQRWINVGLFKFQPSELAKLFFPAFFTYYLASEKDFLGSLPFKNFIPILTILLISIILILKQPDLGTAIIITLSAVILLWLAGIGKNFFIISSIIILIAMPKLWNKLHPYQKQRIIVFLGEGSSKKERYQIEQSYIAIGSGKLYGKGFLKGTQNILQFLPESRTDFIFSIICEEWGFLGAMFLITIYLTLFFRLLFSVFYIKDRLAQLLAIGLIIHIILSTIINIAMVTGLLPIVGIPLPLMSYGITHSWITFASLGWFQAIRTHHAQQGTTV